MAPEPKWRLGILTHHKCASAFVGHYLAKFCEINALRFYWSHLGSSFPPEEYDVVFLTNASYQPIYSQLSFPILHIIRNPLDIIVSAYYSHLATHSLAGWPQLQEQRRILGGCSKNEGLYLTLAFLELSEFYSDTPGPLFALRHWKFDDERILTVRMEDLVKHVNGSLGPILRKVFGLTAILPDRKEYLFETMSGGRPPGEIDNSSHYRSGISGAGLAELPSPIVDYIEKHFSDLLSRYYPDSYRRYGRAGETESRDS